MSALAADLADELIDQAIKVLRQGQHLPKLSFDEWEALFAPVRDQWLRWLPATLDEISEDC